MLERVHRKILRTIQGLPLRCHSKALQCSMGVPSISSLICQRRLNFLHSLSVLPPHSLPLLVFKKRLTNSPRKGTLPIFSALVNSLELPSLPAILNGEWSKRAWKRWVKNLTLSAEYSSFLDQCDHLPLTNCSLRMGKPIPHWSATRGLPMLTRLNNFRIRLLVGCDGLEADASRFRKRSRPTAIVNDPSCKLCMLEPESPVSQGIWYPRKYGTPVPNSLGYFAPLQDFFVPHRVPRVNCTPPRMSHLCSAVLTQRMKACVSSYEGNITRGACVCVASKLPYGYGMLSDMAQRSV